MNIGRILTDAALRLPDRPAFVWGDSMTTYGEAERRASALAAALRRLGLDRGGRVAVYLRNSPQLLETYFAVWKAGGCVVPLNVRFVAGEIAYHLHDAAASVVVFGEEFREVIDEVQPLVPSVAHFVCVGDPLEGHLSYEALLVSEGGAEVAPDHDDDALAWLFYTSGTTGRPKGAMLTHGNLTFMAVGWVADLMPLEPEDVGLHAAPLTHGAGFHAIALALKCASQVISSAPRFDARTFCEDVARHRVTNTWLVPTQITMLLRSPDLDPSKLASLRWVVYGGAPMYVEDLKEAIRRIGPVFVQLYGQGETPMTGTYLRARDHALEGPDSARLASCGVARSGMEVRVLRDDGSQAAPGEPGEICVRGATVMKGYWNQPEATAGALRGGWLHTGDIGARDERGYFYILDRTKDMVITGGSNVYPREVEEVILRHPDVAEVCVFGVPDPLWGEAVTAVVVPEPGRQPTPDEIRAFAARHLADYKRPKTIELVSELPKSAYGKVLKRELRDRHGAGRGRCA